MELPIRYEDASLFTAVWRVEPSRITLPARLEPWVAFGKATVLLCVFEYRATSIGPYNELGLGVLAKKKGSRPSWLRAVRDLSSVEDAALWVVNLPVTTQAACDAGVSEWGYPKYVTSIATSFGTTSRFVLGDELEITHEAARTPAAPGFPLVTWSEKNGTLLRTSIETEFRARWGGRCDVRVTGDGPTARTMRALGIDRPPTFAMVATPMKAALPAGVPA